MKNYHLQKIKMRIKEVEIMIKNYVLQKIKVRIEVNIMMKNNQLQNI